MIPIDELLNRIHWDEEFAKGDFVIGYYDRVAGKLIRIPLREISFEPDDHFSFHWIDREGESHSIPLHRIKEVFKDGKLIWHRTH